MITTPKKADWSQAYAGTPAQYQAQTDAYYEQQKQYLEAQKAPGYIIPGYEAWVAEHVPPTSETALRAKWKMINGPDAPYPGVEVKS